MTIKPVITQKPEPTVLVNIKPDKTYTDKINPLEQPKIEKLDKLVLIQPKPVRTAVNSSQSTYNSYTYGYCTYGVASWRSVPNDWGNANAWLYNARASGYATGNEPKVGAIAWTGSGSLGHVALVIGVSGDSVTIKEMNYIGWNIISTRTVHKSLFTYIY